jgi:uracil-DNA glycosylase
MTELISATNYNYKSWIEKFPDKKVDLFNNVTVDESWQPIFDELKKDKRVDKINALLSKCLVEGKEVFPYPDLVFEAFRTTPLESVRVIVVGQDCYFNKQKVGDKSLPEACGLSFSVPVGIPIPSSLQNIFKNGVKYKHMKKTPTHGNLQSWAKQGCLLINAALTVEQSFKNSHASIWGWFTDRIIEKLSAEREHLVFVLWGRFAYDKLKLIDTDKHETVISSHPSGLSVAKPMGDYSAFSNLDQFGEINKYLKQFGEKEIDWNI